MAESYGFFDAEQLVDGTYDREYLAEQWANYFKLFISNGVFSSPTNQLKVVAYSGMFVKISPGWAFINGYWYHVDVDLEIEVPSNVTASPVVDGVYIRWDSAEREIKARIGVGQTTPNRVAPYYEIKLAEIAVATGATQITDADITDTRSNSSVCGIVTGLIDVIDAGNLFAQYQSIFDTWMNSTDTTFDTWRDDQEAAYAQWYAAIQAELNQDLDDFDTWFDAVKGQLSTDAAGHLQNEIDGIIAQGLSGSIFNIATTNSTLHGRTVTVTGSSQTKTATFDNTGHAKVTGFTDVGTINFTATDGNETATASMTIPYFGNYNQALNFWSATVNIQGDTNLYGATIAVKDSDNTTVGTVTLSSVDGTGVFTATKSDTYTFNFSYGGTNYSETLAVTEETTYSLSLSAGFNWTTWLTAAGIDPTNYADLGELLEDSRAVRKLCTKHASVDYFCGFNSISSVMEGIIANDIFAKWVNNRDYALDNMLANAAIKDVMDEADKYGYGEWCLIPQVPKMTSNTAPSGEVTVNLSYGNSDAYKMFDGNDSTYWQAGTNGNIVDAQVTYHATSPIKLSQVLIRPRTSNTAGQITKYTISGSNDGTNFTPIVSESDVSLAPNENHIIKAESDVAYEYLRLTFDQTGEGNAFYPQISTLQFYAYAPKGLVPIMTSNTAPYGTVSRSGVYSNSYEAWHAFDGIEDANNRFLEDEGTGTKWFGYQSPSPICPKRWYVALGADLATVKARLSAIALVGSNDGTTWETLDTVNTADLTVNKVDRVADISDYYLHLRVNLVKAVSNGVGVLEAQFYGRTLDVSVPKMTSNTAPFGEVFTNTEYNANTAAYRAFDKSLSGESTGFWLSANGHDDGSYVGFHFPSKIRLKELVIWSPSSTGWGKDYLIKNFKLKASNDGETYTTLLEDSTPNRDVNKVFVYNVDTNADYEYFLVEAVGTGYAGGNVAIPELQFFGVDYSEREFESGTTKKWLYDHGLELETLILKAEGGAITTREDSQIVVSTGTGSSSTSQVLYTMDLTNYNLIRAIVGNKYSLASPNSAYLTMRNPGDTADFSRLRAITPLDSPNNYFAIDISNINESCMIQFGADHAANDMMSLAELWVE